MSVENFVKLENAEFDVKNVLTRIKTEYEDDINMISGINQHSLHIGDGEIKYTYLPNVILQNAGSVIKNENGLTTGEEDNITKVKNFIKLENADIDIKVVTDIKTEVEENMIAEINRHCLKIDDTEIHHTYLPNIDLQDVKLSIKNEENSIDIEEGDMVEIKEEINTTYERCQEPCTETGMNYDNSCTSLTEIAVNNSDECRFETKRESTSTRKDSSFKCKQCAYESNQKSSIIRHVESHRTPDQCKICPYKTKYKKTMDLHMLTHENPSAVKKFRCDACPYEATQKRSLKAHALKHNGPSELKMYQCDRCSYETPLKRYLAEHALTHKSPSEIVMFKCDQCAYEAKRKRYLRQHMLSHKDPSQVAMHGCGKCAFATKYKSKLNVHALSHKDLSELIMYRCDVCSYETRYKISLRIHKLNHSDVKTYKCNVCAYATKKSSNLKHHVLVHKSTSEVPMYGCEFCSFETKYKEYIKKHESRHKTSPK